MCKMQLKDLTGQKFGLLTVESYAGKIGKRTAWNCRCECGNTKVVKGTHLQRGNVRSCGCQHYKHEVEDLRGQTFGYWTVLERDTSFQKDTMWKCRCVCGTVKSIRAGSLKSGNSKSCGCKRSDIMADSGYVRKASRTVTDLTGNRYGKLIVLNMIPHTTGKAALWLCQCDCGNTRIVNGVYLRNGTISQCLECSKPFSYRQNYPRICGIWGNMRERCNNPQNDRYMDYGGRGIQICEEWNEVGNFVEWALTHGYKDGLSIDRIDVNGNYEPSNCRWATQKEQANNTRKNVFITYKGEKHSLSVWSEITGICRATLAYRYEQGWDIEDIFNKPVSRHNRMDTHQKTAT